MSEGLFDIKRIASLFSRSAASYDKYSQLQKTLSMGLAAKIKMQCIAPSNILDIGTGTGDLAIMLAQLTSAKKIIGIDIAPGMIEFARKKSKDERVSFMVAGAEELPFTDGSFDVVASSSTYQWVNDISQAFEEVHRVLAEDGCFAFVTFGPKTLIELRKAYKLKANPEATYLHEYKDSDTIKKHLAKTGFKDIEISSKEIRQLYRNCRDLFKVLKGLGALNAMKDHPITLKGHKKMMDLIHYYESTFAQADNVYATYEVIEAVCKKG